MSTEPFVASVETGAVDVHGDDRTDYLNNVLTQRVGDLEPGRFAGALYLDAKGRPLAMADVVALDDRMVLLTPTAGLAKEIADALGARTFLADVTFAAREVAGVVLRGEGSAGLAASAGFDVAPGTAREIGGVLVLGREGGIDVVGAADRVDEVVAALRGAGAEAGTEDDAETWRIEHGVPGWGAEVRAPHLPEEMGLLPTHVHLEKGCYPGQEAVARMWMLGRPRRRLARVHLTGEVMAGWTAGSGRQAVEVTSAAQTPVHDGARAGLAYVPADTEPGERFEGEDGEVVVRDLVGAGKDVPGHDPAVTRRRDTRGASTPSQ